MKLPKTLAAILLALPLAATAQTTPTKTTTQPAAAPKSSPDVQQVTEVTEELDPVTGKVIRRTTRTTTMPAGTAARPTSTSTSTSTSNSGTLKTTGTGVASDTAVSDFFRERTAVARLTAPQLLDAYTRFMDKVREDRRGWQTADWNRAATVLSRLNSRYEQLRGTYTLDDKLTIRGVQGEFQALLTARQISGQVSDKL